MGDGVCMLWICGAPSRPPRSSLGGLDSIDKAYVRATSDECQVFFLEEFGVDPFADVEDDRAVGKVLGWAQLRFLGAYDGELSSQPPSVRAQRNWFGGENFDQRDLRLFQVLGACKLCRPLKALARGHGLARPNSAFFDLTAGFVEELLDVAVHAEAGSVRALLRNLQVEGDAATLQALQLPCTFAKLLVAGSWPSVALRRQAKCSCEGELAQRWNIWREA